MLLGIDFTLGTLIDLGIALNVTTAAIEIANVLSFSQSPWRPPNLLIQEPKVYNDIASKSQKPMAVDNDITNISDHLLRYEYCGGVDEPEQI